MEFLLTCIMSLDKLKFLFINFYQFLEDWNALAVALFAQYEKKIYSIIMHYSSCVGTDPNYEVVPSCLRELGILLLEMLDSK